MATTATTSPLADEDKDPKTRLNIFCQKYSGRMITKEDVAYTVQKVAGSTSYQATVQLHCLEGAPVYAGELHTDKKAAEKQAAIQALAAHADDIQQMITNPAAFTKRARAGSAPPPPPKKPKAEVDLNTLVAPSHKMELNQAIMKIVRGAVVTKTDAIFSTQKTGFNQYVSTLHCPCLPGDWAAKQWIGAAAGTAKDAEHAVAFVALTEMKTDPELLVKMEAAKRTPAIKKAEKKGEGKGKGGGKGGGKRQSQWDWFQEQMMSWMGGGPGDKQRKEVVEMPITGDIVEFKGKFGYIKPHAPVDHPKALKKDGKVWFSLDDVEGKEGNKAPDWLTTGSMISFMVYEDGTGEIGASKINSF